MRKIVLGLVFLIVLAVVGWSILWTFASQEAGHQLDAWLKGEASQGRTWTCPNRSIAGYPFTLTITCIKPTFTATARDQTVNGSLAALVVGVGPANPRHVDVALTPPLTYRTSDGKANVTARWSGFTVGADARSLTLHVTELGADGTFGDAGRQSGNATSLDASFTRLDPPSSQVLGFTIGVRGAGIPPLDAFLGGQSPVDVDLAGQIDHTESADAARTPEEAIDLCRQTGGHVEIASSRISRGESSVSGAGSLQLDEAHRVQGRIDASFVGLEPVLKRYGISGNVAAAGNILSSLFGDGPKEPRPQHDAPNALNLPIVFRSGRLGVGPIQTPLVLAPLY